VRQQIGNTHARILAVGIWWASRPSNVPVVSEVAY
jgi:hypothetical protein